MSTKIYILFDKKDEYTKTNGENAVQSKNVRYVGSSNDVARRLREHITESTTKPHLKKSRWISSIGASAVKYYVVETVDLSGLLTEAAQTKKILTEEQRFIDKYLKAGANLTNEKRKLI